MTQISEPAPKVLSQRIEAKIRNRETELKELIVKCMELRRTNNKLRKNVQNKKRSTKDLERKCAKLSTQVSALTSKLYKIRYNLTLNS